jgi:hypothetical protein
VYGLLHLATALAFLNKDGGSIHGNVRSEALWVTLGGEWKLGGMEVCTKQDDDAGVIWVSRVAALRDVELMHVGNRTLAAYSTTRGPTPVPRSGRAGGWRSRTAMLRHSTRITSISSSTPSSTALSLPPSPPRPTLLPLSPI